MKIQNQFFSKIDTINANIFDSISLLHNKSASTNIYIPNICSINSSIISSFSKELYNHFPVVELNLQASSNRKPGRVNFVEACVNKKTKSKIIVGNMFCQNTNLKNKRILHYGQLVMCMYEVKAKLLEYSKQNPDFITEIHCPKFGTGIFGGNWNFISDLIIDIWPEYKIFVYNRLTERNENV